MQENNVLRDIKASVAKDLHIDLVKNPIHLKMENTAVAIEGMVDRIAHKKKLLMNAMTMPGISGVIDRLRVKPAATMGDKEIKSHIYDAFHQEPTLSAEAGNIEIEVTNGIVDIEGTVHSLVHKRLAGLFAWWVPGSIDVINSLEVTPPEEDSDEELKEAVVVALQQDKLVNHGNIFVTAKNWIVTLSGDVGSDVEREAAEDDAWYIWGVNEVINKVRVRE